MRKFTSRLVAGIATMGLLIAPALPASASSEVINKRTLVNHAKTVGDAGTAYLAVDNGPEDDVVRVGETISSKVVSNLVFRKLYMLKQPPKL